MTGISMEGGRANPLLLCTMDPGKKNRPTFGAAVLDYHFGLKPAITLPAGVEWIFPFSDQSTRQSMSQFYRRYFDDHGSRTYLFGINPGRFGAGITGVPFTDPVRLEEKCGIDHPFRKRAELSSIFIYDCIDAMGRSKAFFKSFYITSMSPLGLIREGKNYNYYDDRQTEERVTPFIVRNITTQVRFGCRTEFAFSIGQGKNYAYFKKLNDEYRWFEHVIPLPHPRWVMQYRLKKKEQYITEYVEKLSLALS